MLGPELAALVISWSREAIAIRGRFVIALSGGSAITMLEDGLKKRGKEGIDYTKWHVLLVDERFVPEDHEDSNLKALKAVLLPLGVPIANIYPVDTGLSSPNDSAENYEALVRDIFKIGLDEKDIPASRHPTVKASLTLIPTLIEGYPCSRHRHPGCRW